MMAQHETQKLRTAQTGLQAMGAVETFNYQSFYEKELDKKHKDKWVKLSVIFCDADIDQVIPLLQQHQPSGCQVPGRPYCEFKR